MLGTRIWRETSFVPQMRNKTLGEHQPSLAARCNDLMSIAVKARYPVCRSSVGTPPLRIDIMEISSVARRSDDHRLKNSYTMASILNVFFSTAFAFAGLAAFGHLPKRNLGVVDTFCLQALWMVIGMSLIQLVASFVPALNGYLPACR